MSLVVCWDHFGIVTLSGIDPASGRSDDRSICECATPNARLVTTAWIATYVEGLPVVLWASTQAEAEEIADRYRGGRRTLSKDVPTEVLATMRAMVESISISDAFARLAVVAEWPNAQKRARVEALIEVLRNRPECAADLIRQAAALEKKVDDFGNTLDPLGYVQTYAVQPYMHPGAAIDDRRASVVLSLTAEVAYWVTSYGFEQAWKALTKFERRRVLDLVRVALGGIKKAGKK